MKTKFLAIVATTISIAAVLVASPGAAAASEFLPHHNQALGRNCEERYIGKGVFSSTGELLLCTKKSATQRGWVLAPSRFIAGAKTKCAVLNQKKIILRVENTCIKFSDGNRFVKTSTITRANNEMSSSAPSPAPSVTKSATPTSPATSTPSPVASPTLSPTPSPTPSLMATKAGSGTGGGAGNGTGGGGGKGASPTPSSTP